MSIKDKQILQTNLKFQMKIAGAIALYQSSQESAEKNNNISKTYVNI
jgi:hypothetical protein